MQRTQNYNLCQWAAEDRILRSDFNADNQKIDAARAAMPYVNIKRMVTEEAAAQIDFDVSDINFTQYLRVDLFFIAPGTEGNVSLRLNGLTIDHCLWSTGGYGSRNITGLSADFGIFYNIGAPSGWVSFFSPMASAKVAGLFRATSLNGTYAEWMDITVMSNRITWETLNSFNFCGSSIPAGSEIVLCGIRK